MHYGDFSIAVGSDPRAWQEIEQGAGENHLGSFFSHLSSYLPQFPVIDPAQSSLVGYHITQQPIFHPTYQREFFGNTPFLLPYPTSFIQVAPEEPFSLVARMPFPGPLPRTFQGIQSRRFQPYKRGVTSKVGAYYRHIREVPQCQQASHTGLALLQRRYIQMTPLSQEHVQIKEALEKWVSQAEGEEEWTERSRIAGKYRQFLDQPSQTRLCLVSRSLKQLPCLFDKSPFTTRLKRLDIELPKLERFPLDICSLENLVDFNFRESKITQIPPQIRQLRSLRTLKIQYIPIQKIPPELYTLQELQTLSLIGTEIEEIGEEITNLLHLKCLQLKQTRIKKLPEAICGLGQLENLSCRLTPLTHLPTQIGKLTQLKELDLQSTNIVFLPIQMRSLYQLNTLFLHDTPFIRKHPLIRGWSAQKIITQNAFWNIPRYAYQYRHHHIHLTIQRELFPLLVKEHLYELVGVLNSCHLRPYPARLSVSYEREPAIDRGGPSREYIASIPKALIAQDLEEHGEMSLFTASEKENGLYHLMCRHETLLEKDRHLCERLGVFLSSLLTGFAEEHRCKIGKVFSNQFYRQLLALCMGGPHLLSDAIGHAAILQQQQEGCEIIAKYDPDYLFYGHSLNIQAWTFKQLRTLLFCLQGNLEVPRHDEGSHTALISLLEKGLENEKGLDILRGKLTLYERYIHANMRQTAHAQYVSSFQPLLIVARTFVQSGGASHIAVANFLNDPSSAVKDLSLAIQGTAWTRQDLVELMQRSTVNPAVKQQVEWITQSLADEESGATEVQMSNMLICITGSAAVSNSLVLDFRPYDDKKTESFFFHTCYQQTDIPLSILHFPKEQFLAYWYEEVAKTKNIYSAR